MKPQYHLVSGAVVSLLLIPVLGVNSAVFCASSVLIDADHYLDYLYRNKFTDFSVKRMFTFHELLFDKGQGRDFLGLNIMHTVEFLLLVCGIAVLTGSASIMSALGGMLFHMVLDLIYLYYQGRLFRRALSIIEYAIRWNYMKRRGSNPQLPYHAVLKAMSQVSQPLGDEEGKATEEN